MIPTVSVVWDATVKNGRSGNSVGHHALAAKPFHCGRETAMHTASPVSSQANVNMKNLVPALISPGEVG